MVPSSFTRKTPFGDVGVAVRAAGRGQQVVERVIDEGNVGDAGDQAAELRRGLVGGEALESVGALPVGVDASEMRALSARRCRGRPGHHLLALALGRGGAALAALGHVEQPIRTELQTAGVVEALGEDGDVGGERGRRRDRAGLLGLDSCQAERESLAGQEGERG